MRSRLPISGFYSLSLFVLLLISTALSPKPGGCLRLDVMLVGDYSGSVAGSEGFVVNSFSAFYNRFELGEEQVKIGVISFNDSPTLVCPLTSDKKLLGGRLATLVSQKADGGTNITSSLMYASHELQENGRDNVRKIIIIVSDGINGGDDDALIAISDQVTRLGFIICTIVIKDPESVYQITNSSLMERIATQGFYVESSYGTLINELEKLDVCL